MPSTSVGPSPPRPTMSYQAGITMPPLMVTGICGACGNTKRVGRSAGRPSSGTTGSKSWPLAPRPCSQITLATAGCCGSISTQGK